METANTNMRPPSRGGRDRTGRVMGGLLIVIVGILLLARQTGVDFPHWIFSFETLLIALGLYIGLRHNFRNFGWLVPTLIGGFLLLDDFYPALEIEKFTWPLVIIGIGLFVMLRSGKKKSDPASEERDCTVTSDEDLLDSVVVFGGIKKQIISKTFMGGEAVTVFGGTELNLTQAEIEKPVVLELTQVFGGTKLILPAHWKVLSNDVVAILGGINDKRPHAPQTSPADDNRVLTLKGTCIFGGIEIQSY